MQAIDIVRHFIETYADRDIEGALRHCADDVVFSWAVDPEVSAYSGPVTGRDAFLARLKALDADFVYRSYRAVDIIASGERVAAQMELHMTNRHTEREFVMRVADFWTIRDGKIVEMVEYYDTALAAQIL